MSNKVAISIIVPVFNSADYLERCLESIAAQSFGNFEVIAVDDGSTDASAASLDRFAGKDSRFKVIHKKNGGVSAARNDALEVAVGEYVMFVDSDDALQPGSLMLMYDKGRGCDFVLGGYCERKDSGKEEEFVPFPGRFSGKDGMTEFWDRNLRHNCKMMDAPWAKLFLRKKVGNLRFDTGLSYAEDKIFVFSFLEKCDSAACVDLPVYSYYIRGGSLGCDISSDRHLLQLRHLLVEYAPLLSKLRSRFPDSVKVASLYHDDLVMRYCCRILNVFLTRRTSLLDEEFISWIYSLMSADTKLNLFTIRIGQVPNYLLFKLNRPAVTVRIYNRFAR